LQVSHRIKLMVSQRNASAGNKLFVFYKYTLRFSECTMRNIHVDDLFLSGTSNYDMLK